MPLKKIIDTLDGVDETQKAFYVQKDGKFHLDIEVDEDVSGLQKALKSERDLRAKYEKQAKALERLGKSPEEIEAILEAQRLSEEDKAKKAGDFDAIRKQDQDKHAKEVADLKAELEGAQSSERQAIVENHLLTALTKSGATEEGLDLLPERLEKRIKIERIDGKRQIKIMLSDGATPMAGSAKDGTATFDDLITEAKTKWPSLFAGNGSGGSGKRPNDAAGSGKTIRKEDFDNLSPAEKAKSMREKVTVID